jgi:hypothetical protein
VARYSQGHPHPEPAHAKALIAAHDALKVDAVPATGKAAASFEASAVVR